LIGTPEQIDKRPASSLVLHLVEGNAGALAAQTYARNLRLALA
jgi:hypothetical protein